MSVFDKITKRGTPAKATSQMRTDMDFCSFFSYPTQVFSPELYRALRESVPIIDAAIGKIVRLTGGFKVTANNEKYQNVLDEFVNKIPVGAGRVGLSLFMDTYFEELLTYGVAAGEIILSGDNISSLYNVPVKNIKVKRSENDISKVILCNPNSLEGEPIRNQELLVYSALNPEAGEIIGTSVLKGLPFCTDVLMKIYSSIGKNFERMGNLRYAVTYNPGGDVVDRSFAKERAMGIANEWSSAMNSSEVRDFVAVGDVNIRVIGADNQIIDSEIPVRQMLEQILSKFSLPPFMLGLSWSTTERMSSSQADALTTELWSYRKALTPVIERLCEMWLRFYGNTDGVKVEWDEITLQDAVDEAKARLYKAQALKIEQELGGEKLE